MGTAQYLSPEQAQGQPVSAPSDLYSIGIILYEMLTGRVPFDGESAVTIALKQVNEAPVPPSQPQPAVPPALEDVVLRALEKDPARRFADADDVHRRAGGRARRSATGRRRDRPQPTRADGPVAAAGRPPPTHRRRARPTTRRSATAAAARTTRGRPWWVACWSALLVVGAIVAGLLLTGKDKVNVPNVVGKPQAESELVLKRAGLQDRRRRSKESDTPPGDGHRPGPGGGSRVAEGLDGHADGQLRARAPRASPTRRPAAAARRASSSTEARLRGRPRSSRPATRSPTNHVIGTRPAAGPSSTRARR